MIIKNNSSKIINVGTTVLMPDASMQANKKMRKNPALMTFEKKGLITFVEEEKDKTADKNARNAAKPASATTTVSPASTVSTEKPVTPTDTATTAPAATNTETQK